MDIEENDFEFLFYEEARQVANDFQYLIGKPYYFGYTDAVIECVIVAPFDHIIKPSFVDDYRILCDEVLTLAKYDIDCYDVIVVAHDTTDYDEVYFMGLRLFARIHQIEYQFPPYPFNLNDL